MSKRQNLKRKLGPMSKSNEKDDDDTAEKRESLSILASLGTTKEFLGVEMNLGDIKKRSAKDVEKYFNRYQTKMGQQVTCGLVESAIQLVSKTVSYVIPIDDSEKLANDLQKVVLVKCELSNTAGYLVLKGGRFVALASALCQVAKHVKINTTDTTQGTTQDQGVDEHTPAPHLRDPCDN